jgi:Na+/H+ antiporter NhaA
LWLFVLNSGVHATLAGVCLAAATPLRSNGPDEGERSPLHRLENALQPYVAFDGDQALMSQVKLGAPAGSLASIIAGTLLLRLGGDRQP